jgi:hypothetical protein
LFAVFNIFVVFASDKAIEHDGEMYDGEKEGGDIRNEDDTGFHFEYFVDSIVNLGARDDDIEMKEAMSPRAKDQRYKMFYSKFLSKMSLFQR